MDIRISFPLGTFKDSGAAFLFIHDVVKFDINVISSVTSFPDGDWFSNVDDVATDLSTNNDHIFDLHDGKNIDDHGMVSVNAVVFRREPYYNLEVFAIGLKEVEKLDYERLIKKSAECGFTTIIGMDFLKAKWQSERFVQNYITFGKPHEHLDKMEDLVLGKSFGPVIDISKNPGHEIQTYEMCLMAAPEMWFGPGSWKYFDKKLVSTFPNGIEVNEILPDVVYVKLFDWTTPDYETPEILALQKKFRKWVKMDEVEANLNNMTSPLYEVATLKLDLKDPDNPKEEFSILSAVKNIFRKKK